MLSKLYCNIKIMKFLGNDKLCKDYVKLTEKAKQYRHISLFSVANNNITDWLGTKESRVHFGS
jgi:hypothetical protein